MSKPEFVIVPIEPTQEMADAGFSRYKRTTVGAYEVMIEAAPSHNLAIIDKGEYAALIEDAATLYSIRENCDHEHEYIGDGMEQCTRCKHKQAYNTDGAQDGSDNTM